jgi:hypothetical protein
VTRRLAVLPLLVALALPAAAAATTINGTPRADSLRGTAAADLINGRGGDDRLRGAGGADRLKGGPGRDRLLGGPGPDRLAGDGGNDVLDGGPGRDRLAPGAGRDRLDCGGARDTVLADRRDLIDTDCERVLDSRTGARLLPAADIPGAHPPGAEPPPGKVCHLETKTVLVQEGFGSQAQYVLKPQVVVICVDGATQTNPAPPQCSDGRDNDNDLATDYPTDKGCDSATDPAEYPDRVGGAEPLLTARDGFWWQQADATQLTGVCNLYRFRITPQGDRIGTRQAWFLNPISRVCLPQTFAPAIAYTWRTTEFSGPPVPEPFKPLGTLVRLEFVGGSVVQMWLFVHSPGEDAIGFSTGAPPGQPGAVLDILWGCTSPNYPQIMRPPNCP